MCAYFHESLIEMTDDHRNTIEQWFSCKIDDIMTFVSDYARNEAPEYSLDDWRPLVKAKSLEIFDSRVNQNEGFVDTRNYMIEVFGLACIIIGYKVYMGYDYIDEEDKFFTRVSKEIETEIPLYLVVEHMKEVELDILKHTLFDIENKILFH